MHQKKPLQGPLLGICIILTGAIAVRLSLTSIYWWDHSNPVFAIWFGLGAGFNALISMSLIASILTSADGAISRFCSQESPWIPTFAGLAFVGAGLYGMLVLPDFDDVETVWIVYGAVAGLGAYILKRTFSISE
jgi:hypothetical protein